MTTTTEAPYKVPHPCAVPWCGEDHVINPDQPHAGDTEEFRATLDYGCAGTWLRPANFYVGVEQLETGGEVMVTMIGLNGGALLLPLQEARRMAAWMTQLCDDVDGVGA